MVEKVPVFPDGDRWAPQTSEQFPTVVWFTLFLSHADLKKKKKISILELLASSGYPQNAVILVPKLLFF